MENKSTFIDPNKRDKMLRTAKIPRLPVGKGVSFKLPTSADPARREINKARRVQLISAKNFKNLNTFNRNALFQGSLKIL
jgi:hypothetical protein